MSQQNPAPRMRSSSPAFWSAMFLIALGLSVVLWGTAYKLSLYHPSEPRGDMPAKLCTRSSDIAQDNVRHAMTWPARTPEIRAVSVEETPGPIAQLAERPKTVRHAPSPLELRPQHMLRPPPSLFRADV